MQSQIPNNWQITTLAGTASLNYGKGLPENKRTEGSIPVYGSSGITGYNDQALINEPGYIIGRKGTVGSIYYSDIPFYPIDTVYYSTKSDIKCDFNFFYYLLKTLKLEKLNSDSAVPGLNRDTAYAQKVILPTLPEQKKIFLILSAFDDKIEVNNKIAKTLEEMTQAIFKEGFINNKTWKLGKLSDLVNIKNGFAFKSKDYKSNGIPVVRTMNFTNNKSVILDDVVFLNKEKAKEYKDFYLDKFDLLLVMVGASIGKVALTPSNILPALQNQNMWSFKPKNSEYRFFNNLLIERTIKQQIHSSTGSARDFFRKDYFYSVEVPIPEIEVIRKFNNIIEPIYLKLDNLINENQKLAALRDLLLPKLMKGEIRV